MDSGILENNSGIDRWCQMRKLPLDIGFTYEDTIIEITIMLKGKVSSHFSNTRFGFGWDDTCYYWI